MGDFSAHLLQSKSNLRFLEKVNSNVSDSWDWQVTTCFYSALHLISAHIADKTGKNYLSHHQVSHLINFEEQLSPAKLDQQTYISYQKLLLLSRRSRYLIQINEQNKSSDIMPVCLTYDKHFKKAVYHLDIIMSYMSKNYNVTFDSLSLNCIELKKGTYDNITVL